METTQQAAPVYMPPTGAPRVLNKKTDEIPQDAFYVGRGTKYGNKFKINKDGDRETVIRKCIEALPDRKDLRAFLDELRGRDLVCFCSPEFCHAHVYVFAANPELQNPAYWRNDIYEILKPLAYLDALANELPSDDTSDDGACDELTATGAMLLGTLLDEMERRDASTGLVTLCIGAGMGTATIIERV